MKMKTYTLWYISPKGKKQKLEHPLTGDADARLWANYVVEQAGGSASIELSDGTMFIAPQSAGKA